MKEFEEHKEFRNPPSELFRDIACNVVDFYNLTQECCGSDRRMEYPKTLKENKMNEDVDYDERKSTLKQYNLKDLDEIIDQNIDDFEAKKLKEIYIDFILDYDLDLRNEQ